MKAFISVTVLRLNAPFEFNGTKTVGESTSDNLGILLAYRAYEELVKEKGEEENMADLGLNPKQVFFLSYAQIKCAKETQVFLRRRMKDYKHPAPRFRLVGVLRNSPEFAEAYNCPLGSPMNPEEKCSRIYGS
ncbi:endothelin-converting enzyme 1 [Elysia marginata]|uniref:Endothelin-converting enzyme 1 n=1 Tax=Elysia marginata TaxID=1093978 RepID=A0AAV4IS49_9GAST|nr:endothelin-converting enzyme 1 [Elysia marginata]